MGGSTAILCGIVFASAVDMTPHPAEPLADETTVMWRMERPDGRSAHLVIGCGRTGTWVAWFLNGRPIGRRTCDDLGHAITFSNRMQTQNWSVGWRLATEQGDDGPPESEGSDD